MSKKSYVIISEAPQLNYLIDYVALPENYGTPEYFGREDVKAIRETVYQNLNDLNKKTNFGEKIKTYEKVLIKPNLVAPYHKFGFKADDYPETTDPRVFEAVVSFIKQFNDNIVIIESSGKGMPTTASFKITGLDRVAKHYGTGLVPLELQPVVRYMVPKAEIMKEVYIPEILDQVVKGTAFYISVPKMKTNTYTDVTLGFKNAMGTLPYNLRERNHTYHINKKLADLLYLFKPDLTVIDGIIGGEGNTPAPVDPVEMGVIVSGDNSVETDRVATRMMGFDPNAIKLQAEADKRGFNNSNVEVIGHQKVVPFRPALKSIMDEGMQKTFPNLTVLVGFSLNDAPEITDINAVTPELVKKIEMSCDGGCIPTIKFNFEAFKYSDATNYEAFDYVLIVGNGVTVNGKKYYFDAEGKAYDTEAIRKMDRKKVGIGECVRHIEEACDVFCQGCPSIADIPNALSGGAGVAPPLFSPQNVQLPMIFEEVIKLFLKKQQMIQAGIWVDCESKYEDRIFEIPELSDEEKAMNYIEWPLPEVPEHIKEQALKAYTLPL